MNARFKEDDVNEAKIIKRSIKRIKDDYGKECKKWDHGDWYGQLESYIDGDDEIYDSGIDQDEDYELILERMVFEGCRIATNGQRHQCDEYYDDAFDGYDCMSKVGR